MNIQFQSCVPGSTSWPCPGLKPNSTELRDVVSWSKCRVVGKTFYLSSVRIKVVVGKEEEVEEDG